jgi:hypothetical protein
MGEMEKKKRGIRVVYTSKPLIPGMGEGVFCVIGPFDNFDTDMQLQHDIEVAAMARNRQSGHLHHAKHKRLLREKGARPAFKKVEP